MNSTPRLAELHAARDTKALNPAAAAQILEGMFQRYWSASAVRRQRETLNINIGGATTAEILVRRAQPLVVLVTLMTRDGNTTRPQEIRYLGDTMQEGQNLADDIQQKLSGVGRHATRLAELRQLRAGTPDWAQGKTFTHPKSRNKVQWGSLPAEEQAKLRSQHGGTSEADEKPAGDQWEKRQHVFTHSSQGDRMKKLVTKADSLLKDYVDDVFYADSSQEAFKVLDDLKAELGKVKGGGSEQAAAAVDAFKQFVQKDLAAGKKQARLTQLRAARLDAHRMTAEQAMEAVDRIRQRTGEQAKALRDHYNVSIREMNNDLKRLDRAWHNWDWKALEDLGAVGTEERRFVQEVEAMYSR